MDDQRQTDFWGKYVSIFGVAGDQLYMSERLTKCVHTKESGYGVMGCQRQRPALCELRALLSSLTKRTLGKIPPNADLNQD